MSAPDIVIVLGVSIILAWALGRWHGRRANPKVIEAFRDLGERVMPQHRQELEDFIAAHCPPERNRAPPVSRPLEEGRAPPSQDAATAPEPRTFCTVGDLLAYVAKCKIPANTSIYYQRIEDKYFEKHGWTTTPYVFEQYLGRPPHISTAIQAFQPNWTQDADGKPILVIEAHY